MVVDIEMKRVMAPKTDITRKKDEFIILFCRDFIIFWVLMVFMRDVVFKYRARKEKENQCMDINLSYFSGSIYYFNRVTCITNAIIVNLADCKFEKERKKVLEDRVVLVIIYFFARDMVSLLLLE